MSEPIKIAVCVKQVKSLDDEFELSDGALLEDDLERELNEWDAVALEAALQLREAAPEGGEVIALTVGDEEAGEVLIDCMARGADASRRIWSPELEGADAIRVAAVLAASLRDYGADLILCGVQSADAVNAATGSALAGLLDLPRVAVVKAVEHDAATGSATVRRELEGGTLEVVRVATPALLTIQTGSFRPRYANLRAIRQAREKRLDVLSLTDLGLDGATLPAGAERRELRLPDASHQARMLAGSIDEVALEIKSIIAERVAR